MGRVFAILSSSILLSFPLSRTALCKRKSEEIFDAFFAEPDLSFLTPIQRPKAFDPLRGVFGDDKYKISPLKWLPGKNTSREAAFEKILDFAQKNDAKVLRGRKTRVPFKMLLIVGPLSSGKSRLAMEAARKLARRDVWGGDAADKKKLAMAGVGLRSLWPRTYRDDDPWDAWWLAGPSSFDEEDENGPYTSWEHRKQMREDPWMEKLKAWRPRRPTIFLLDDPLPGDAHAVANALHGNEALYRHPVRLMIVSPMPPDRLENKSSAIRKAKTIILSGDNSFTEGDIRVAGGILGNDRNPLWRKEAVAYLHSITKGNPLLVEIALDMLRRGRDQGQMPSVVDLTRERLLTDRVERWREALKSRGISRKQEHALAAATLAASAKQARLRRFLGEDARIDEDVVRELFPGMKAENKGFEIPPLRPIMIGDAFVRNIIEEHCDKESVGTRLSEADKVIAAAWHANPLGMITSIERLSAVDDVLGGLITKDPIADLKVGKKGEGFDAEIAKAWALTAMRVPRAEWDAGNKTGLERTMMVALGMIDRLSPAVACSSLQDFINSIPISNENWIVRSRDASRLIETWVEKALLDSPSWKGAKAFGKVFALDRAWWRLIDIWGLKAWEHPASDTTDIETKEVGLRKAYQRAVATLTSQKEAQQYLPEAYELAENISPGRAPFHAAATLHGFALLAQKASDKILAERLWIQANAYGQNRETCNSAIADFEQMATGFSMDSRIQLERTKAYYSLCYVNSIFKLSEEFETARAEAEQAAKKAITIIDKFSGNQNFELVRAKTLSILLYVYTNKIGADLYNKRLNEIMAQLESCYVPFFYDYKFVLELVTSIQFCVWSKVLTHDVESINTELERINKVVAPLLHLSDRVHHLIAFDLCEVHGYLVSAYAQRSEKDACWEALQRLEQQAKPFAGDSRVEVCRVEAWQNFCQLDSLDKAQAKKAFDIVEIIAAPFSGDTTVELSRARAACALAWKIKDDPLACKAFVNRVAKIAGSFRGKLDFEVEHASAYAALSWGDGNDLASACQACDEIKRIAEKFPMNVDIHMHLATALCHGKAFAAQRAKELAVCREAVEQTG